MSRFTYLLRDDNGDIIGARSITRHQILTADISAVNGFLYLILTCRKGELRTYPQPVRNQTLVTEKVATMDGKQETRDKTAAMGGVSMRDIQLGRWDHETLEVEPTVARDLWAWLHEDSPGYLTYDQMMEIQKEMLDKVRKAQEEAEQKRQEAEAAKEPEGSPHNPIMPDGVEDNGEAKIVNVYGEEATPQNVQ